MNYSKKGKLSVATDLFEFINNELLPGTKINPEKFWKGFDKAIHELAPKNRKLLLVREEMQKKIDEWHIKRKGKEFDSKAYESFLKERNDT